MEAEMALATSAVGSPALSPKPSLNISLPESVPPTPASKPLLSPPADISPDPIFIAASAASQIVTNDHDSQADSWFDQHGIEPSGETALVAPAALKLVNGFLDQLLFNFLAVSRSTSLASLRPSVSDVLKPKLARDAISGADQELHEYLGGGEDEELLAFHNGLETGGDWDLELVWKRTRLRCMVYSSLGDMEEEDEDAYTELDNIDNSYGDRNRFSNSVGVVSPAVAIFLTSILEYMGEQALIIAGQAAYHRIRAKYEAEEIDGLSTPNSDIADRVVVEELDMEKVALDRTLGRLWRGWKKRMRSPNDIPSLSRALSHDSVETAGSIPSSPADAVPITDAIPMRPSVYDMLENHQHAANIPLPISDNDVQEIETPWLKLHPDDLEPVAASETSARRTTKRRPTSLMIFRTMERGLPTPEMSVPNSPTWNSSNTRKRSFSVPSPVMPSSSKKARQSEPDSEEDVSDEVGDESETVPSSHDEASSELQDKDEMMEEEDFESVNDGSESTRFSGLVASAAAIGVAAIAGIAAAAKGEVPKTTLLPEEADMVEDPVEEAQIMTSARVPIGGRISPEHLVPLTRHSSLRSHSVHSLRLVDVTAPRSPGRSRQGSVDASELLAARAGISRSLSAASHTSHDMPRIASPVQRASTASPTMRNTIAHPISISRAGSSMSVRPTRNSASDSISEVDESPHEDSADEAVSPIPLPDKSPLRDSKGIFSQNHGREDSIPSPDLSSYQKSFTEPKYVLAAAPPAPESWDDAPQTPVKSQSYQPKTPETIRTILTPKPPKHPGPESGVPNLTPLREMMEGAQDTSSETSSTSPSGPHTDGPSEYLNGQSPVAKGKRVENFRPARTTSIPRPAPSQLTRNDDTTPRPEDYVKPGRSIHTSDSNASGHSKKLWALRNSEDSSTSDKGKSFDELIQSDQTIQYTLTPQKISEIEPTLPELARPVGMPQLPSSSSIGSSQGRPGTANSIKRLTGLNSNPPTEQLRRVAEVPQKPIAKMPTTQVTTLISQPRSGAQRRATGPQAREARVERESIGDFAEFIRSTGPPGARGVPQQGLNGAPRNVSQPTQRVTNPAPAPVRRTESSAGRARLQAREPVVPYGGSSSELIDFIRQGPASSNPHEQPRISRTVAPFRTTMDSEVMAGASISRGLDTAPDQRYSQASTDTMQPSHHSSIASHSALLNNHYKASAQKNDLAQKYNTFDEDEMIPKRKTRRILDPYAIPDSDDDDDFDFMEQPSKPVRAEESLIDFLNNVPPPPADPTPIPEPAERAGMKKKTSSVSLMSRFSRKDSVSVPPAGTTRANTLRSNGVSPSVSSHTPIAAKNSNGYGTTINKTPGYNSHVPADRSHSSPRGVQQKSFQAREPVLQASRHRTATNDLADFLMNTPPPPSMNNFRDTEPVTQQKQDSLSRMFGRKKKVAAM